MHTDQEILNPMEEPKEAVEKPQVEEQRVDTTTQAETSREGRKRGKLKNYCRILESMWEHPQHNADRGGHSIGTLDTWI